ncbi:MAG: MaoC/PaaZ C-terminal domain-containing protein [Planctomycetota bacterium]
MDATTRKLDALDDVSSKSRAHVASPGHQSKPQSPKVLAAQDSEPLLYWEDIEAGDHWTSASRSISSNDVEQFADLTGDHTGLHDQVSNSPFGEPVVHGLLGLGVMAGLSSENPRMATLALVGVEDWKFEAPIFFEDRVRVRTEVLEVTPHGRRAGRVVWKRELINEQGRVVQSGRIITLVASRNRVSSNGDRPKRPR